ncbi:chromatin assembly factor 1 subunit fas1 [Phtheirospermum japonicum]|uniref:Chromatin assembly factor 1 subunit fas1 n=1 Tax=Phtheirospermum japonicum TaxID=374723 RepID=A0A830C933_9LAMI|nr:chromatin assembly factor 1 subunit fas1 [Phtheirospermum japonicum]
MEESDLPLSKLVDEIFEKVKGRAGMGESVSKASVKSIVLMIGQRLCYGEMNPDVDLLEDEAECALWCWETRDLKLMPKLVRVSVKVRRTCRKKIHERIITVLAMISALKKSEDRPNCLQELKKASEKLGKVLNEADIRLLMETMSHKHGAEMAEKESKKEEKILIKQMEKNKRDMEKERKKMDRELEKEKLQSQRELKRLHDEAEKEERRREKEESDMQKQLKRQQEEAEKDKKRKENEKAELKKQLALQKQASLMEQFLKSKKATITSQQDSSLNKTTSKSSSTTDERKSEAVSLNMDSVLAQNAGFEAEAIWRSHLKSWHCIGRSIRSNRKQHWGIRQKPKAELVKELKLVTNRELTCDEEKLVDGWVDSNVDGRSSQMNIDRPHPNCQKLIRSKQLLQFDKSCRPAFYGVWPRKSQVVGARHPFAKDLDIDYDIDSDEEWEEEEPGESLSDCDKEDEDEKMEGHLKGDDDEDESEDGFFVPDGYLSENEGAHADEMECDELVEEVRNLPVSETSVQSEEFYTLLRRQKYLNSLTEQALRKNQPLIILNLMHEKIAMLPAEELTGIEKLEQMCLQALSIRPLPDFPHIKISICDSMVVDDLEASPNNSSITSFANAGVVLDSDLPQIISIIQACPNSIGKIVNSLNDKFPALPKSQLRNKVREISEFSENRWQVKKEILSKLGLSISPDKNCVKAKSIASFFTKRCMPPSEKTMNSSESSPQTSQKLAGIDLPRQDCSFEHR